MRKIKDLENQKILDALLTANTLVNALEDISDDGQLAADVDSVEILSCLVDALKSKIDNVKWL